MNTPIKSFVIPVVVAVACGVLTTCVSDLAVGPGTGSETTNGFMAVVRYQDGSPASGATVKVRPADFLRGASLTPSWNEATAVVDAMTDSLGRFSVGDMEPDDYVIEVIDSSGSEGVLLRARVNPDSVMDFGVRFLDQLGRISGTLDYSGLPDTAVAYLQIFGMDRIDRVDVSTGRFTVDGMPVGTYTLRLFTPAPSYLPDLIENIAVTPAVATELDTVTLTLVSNWCCSRKVYLNTTASGADVGVTIRKFPVLVRMTNNNFDFVSARQSGADIRFVKSDNSPLPYHIERWDPFTGFAEVWVKVDTVLGNNNTQYFVMLWGNPDAESEASSAEVFDTAMGFAGVWHMNESDSAAITDATGNLYNGRKYAIGSAAVQGMCGLAQRFDGSSQYIVLSNTASSKLNFAENGTYSVSAWVYAEALDGDYHSIVSKGNQQYGLQLAKDNSWQFFEFKHRVGWDGVESPAVAGSWKYVTGVRAGSRQYLYVDGALVDSTITTTEGVVNRNTADNVFIGRRTLDTTRFWNGMIDEVRICSWAHSVNWVKLCYMNQKQEDELVELR